MAAATEKKPEEAERYVSVADAVKLVGVTRGTLQRWITLGKVRAQRPGAGQAWQVWLEDVYEVFNGSVSDRNDEDLEDELGANATVYGQVVRALQQAHRHVEQLIAPAKTFLEGVAAENQRLRERNAQLEDKLLASADKYEQAMTLEHQRRQDEERERRSAMREQQVWEMVLKWGPTVATGMAGHFGLGNVQEALLTTLVQQMPQEQFIAFARHLPPEIYSVLERVRATAKKEQNTNGQQAA